MQFQYKVSVCCPTNWHFALKLRMVSSIINCSRLIVYIFCLDGLYCKEDYPREVSLLALRIDPKMLIPSNPTGELDSNLLQAPKPTIKKLINDFWSLQKHKSNNISKYKHKHLLLQNFRKRTCHYLSVSLIASKGWIVS